MHVFFDEIMKGVFSSFISLVWGGKFGTHAGKNQKRKTKSNLK
jgi:hypothetical protein